MTRLALSATALGALLLAAACAESRMPRGGDAGSRDGGLDADAAVLGCGTAYDNDCPDGTVCYGSLECGSVWECSEPRAGWPPTCSAAGPVTVCDCEGYVAHRAAGCPNAPYASYLGQFGGLDLRPGLRCDPERRGPYPMTYRVHGSGFEAYEGLQVHWLIRASSDLPPGAKQVSQVQAGGFEASVGPIENGNPAALIYFIDSDGDGVCESDADPATAAVEPGGEPAGYVLPTEFDLVAGTYDYRLTPAASADPTVCDRFAER